MFFFFIFYNFLHIIKAQNQNGFENEQNPNENSYTNYMEYKDFQQPNNNSPLNSKKKEFQSKAPQNKENNLLDF